MGLSEWSLLVPAWLLIGYLGFLPQSVGVTLDGCHDYGVPRLDPEIAGIVSTLFS